jgi:hypothetical protein
MFPFIVKYKKTLNNDFDLISNKTILTSFEENLKRDGVDKLSIVNDSILNFKNYFFAIRPGLNWNIWVGISNGKIEIEKSGTYREVTYLFNTSRFFIIGLLSGFFFWSFSKEFLAGLLAFTVIGVISWIISIIRHRINLNVLLDEVIRNEKN